MQDFPIAGRQSAILALEKSEFTANIIKRWLSEDLPLSGPPVALEISDFSVNEDGLAIHWDAVEGIAEIASYVATLDTVRQDLPASSSSVTFSNVPAGNHTFVLSARDGNDDFLGTIIRHLIIDPTEKPQVAADLPLGEWLERKAPGWLIFDLPSPGFLNLTLTIPDRSRDLDMVLYSSDDISRKLSSSATFSPIENIYLPLDAGAYYVEIREWGQQLSPSSFFIQREFVTDPLAAYASVLAPVPIDPDLDGSHLSFKRPGSRESLSVDIPEAPYRPASYDPELVAAFKTSDPLAALSDLIREYGPQPCVGIHGNTFRSFTDFFFYLSDNARDMVSGEVIPPVDFDKISDADAALGPIIAKEGQLVVEPDWDWAFYRSQNALRQLMNAEKEFALNHPLLGLFPNPAARGKLASLETPYLAVSLEPKGDESFLFLLSVVAPDSIFSKNEIAERLPPTLSISPDHRFVSNTSGKTTFHVRSSGHGYLSWNAISLDPWLVIESGASGVNSQTIGVRYDAYFPTSETSRIGTVILSASDGTRDTLTIRQAHLRDYQIGHIPPATVGPGETMEFLVHADEGMLVGEDGLLMEVMDGPKTPGGSIEFDSESRLFSYKPAPGDTQFDIEFSASSAEEVASQRVSISFVPDEQDVFIGSSTRANPLDYTILRDTLSADSVSFNYQTRHLRTVDVYGKTIVFQAENELFKRLQDRNRNIESLNVYADSLVINSELRLPQTDVTIHARVLRFGEKGRIITTPLDTVLSIDTTSADILAENGLDAGDITLNIDSFYADPDTSKKRFILTGGRGQPAAFRGEDGLTFEPGTIDFEQLNFPDEYCESGWEDGWPWESCWPRDEEPYWRDRVIYYEEEDCIYWDDGGSGGSWCEWTVLYHGDIGEVTERLRPLPPGPVGEDATAAGKPGEGGAGGNVKSKLAVVADYVENGGGQGGAPGHTRSGYWDPQYYYYIRQTVKSDPLAAVTAVIDSINVVPGGDKPPTLPENQFGLRGRFIPFAETFSWLHPLSLRMTLAYAKDTYRFGHLDEAAFLLRTYVTALDEYRESSEWSVISDTARVDFGLMHDEMRILLHRMDSNLDYYGNPAGWVPMLSLEVTAAVYDAEIEHAIRVFYLSRWLQQVKYDTDQKKDALEEARGKLADEITSFQSQYTDVAAAIPALQETAASIRTEIDTLQRRLDQVSQRLLRQAKDNEEGAFWQGIIRSAGSLMSVFPIGQPVIGALGQGLVGLSLLSDTNPANVLSGIGSLAAAGGKLLDPASWASANIDVQKKKEDMLALGGVSGFIDDPTPFYESLQNSDSLLVTKFQKELKKVQVPKTDIEAEFMRLRSSDIEFNQIIDRLAVLLASKEKFAQLLTQTMQTAADLPNRIDHNYLAIDVINQDIAAELDVLNPRTLAYVKDMEHRARERLQKYQYYMAKAFEYSMLESYVSTLNLSKLSIEIESLIANSTNSELSDYMYMNLLKPAYQTQISNLIKAIFTASETPGSFADIEVTLSPHELQSLNAGLPVTLSPLINSIPPEYEDTRVKSIEIIGFLSHAEDGSSDMGAEVNLMIEHSGVSRLRSEGEYFLFRHSRGQEAFPYWEFTGRDGETPVYEPDLEKAFLLASLIDKGSGGFHSFYSRPSIWSDFTLTLSVHADMHPNVLIDSLRLKFTYSRKRDRSDFRELRVRASNNLRPNFGVHPQDKNQRQSGIGAPILYRMYNKDKRVTLSAPMEHGRWKFDRWWDRLGKEELGTDSTCVVSMDDPRMIDALYSMDPWRFSFARRTGKSYSILVQSATTGGSSLELGDEIGVFTPDGICVGALVWTAEGIAALTAWADDSETSATDGYSLSDSEPMSFKLWDDSESLYRHIESATYVEGDGSFGTGSGSLVELVFSEPDTLPPETVQTIPLLAGWSWISFNVQPADSSIPAVMRSCEQLALMQNIAGDAYWPAFDHDDITDMNIFEGYKVYLNDPDTLEVHGIPVIPASPILLKKGWNFVSYLPIRPIDAKAAFASISEKLIIATNDDGRSYFPQYALNDIGLVRPGQGYKLYLSAPDTLLYPNMAVSKQLAIQERQLATPKRFVFEAYTGEFHSVLITAAEGLVDGDEIAAFTQDGQCVGSVVWEGQAVSLPAWKDDERTPEKDGWQPGDRLRFQVWDHAEDRVTESEASYVEGTDLPGEMPIAIVRLSARSLPREYALSQNHPNPFNPSTTIRYALPKDGKVTLSIYNMVGQKIQALVDSWQQAGTYVTRWDGKDESGREVGSGIYLCRMESGAFTRVNKMVLLK